VSVTDTGFVGLDPDLARDLARQAGTAGETADHIASEVAGILSVAQVPDNGFAALCSEVGEELGLLEAFLDAKATEIELAGSGAYMSVSAGAAAALWASLTDDTGEGVDFDDELGDEEATVTMSSSVAATALATYLGWLGEDGEVDIAELSEMAQDENLPPEVRAAAQYFVVNPEVFLEVTAAPSADAASFQNFVEINAALALAAANYTQWEIAADEDRTPDGELSYEDLQAVAANENGEFTEAEQKAAELLLNPPYAYALWQTPQVLTDQLYKRRVLADDPELAVQWLEQVRDEPGTYIHGNTWFDSEAGQAWLNTALASTSDPAKQAEILLGFATVYQATMPEPVGLLTIVHDLLDGVSFLDPTQLADLLNAGIYALEGDNANATMSAAGMLLPIGGGKVIRLTREAFAGLAARHGDEVVELLEARLKRLSESGGELTDETIEQIVKEVGDQFGDDTASAVRRILDDVRSGGPADDVTTMITTSGGRLTVEGQGFSASELRVAQELADSGDNVVVRQATGVAPTSDLLVNGVPYDVYTPTTGSVDRIVSAVASKGAQVDGGGVIIDLSRSPLTSEQLGDILPRVQNITGRITDIRVYD
jgi:hypothetical protein